MPLETAAAGAFDAHHIKVGNIPGTPCELAQITERFGELCADAAQYTDAKVVYELMPFDVNVNTLDAALAVVEGAAADNGGLAIDTWHMSKLGIEPIELTRVPLEYLSRVELSDGLLDDIQRDQDAWMQPHWVGDLTLELNLEVLNLAPDASVRLELIKAGVAQRCTIDPTSGLAVVTRGDVELGRWETPIKGPGRYSVQFSDVDDRVS